MEAIATCGSWLQHAKKIWPVRMRCGRAFFNCRPAAASDSPCPKKAVPHLYWGAALLVHELLLAIGYGQQLVFKGRNHAQGFDHVGEVFDDKVHFFLR